MTRPPEKFSQIANCSLPLVSFALLVLKRSQSIVYSARIYLAASHIWWIEMWVLSAIYEIRAVFRSNWFHTCEPLNSTKSLSVHRGLIIDDLFIVLWLHACVLILQRLHRGDWKSVLVLLRLLFYALCHFVATVMMMNDALIHNFIRLWLWGRPEVVIGLRGTLFVPIWGILIFQRLIMMRLLRWIRYVQICTAAFDLGSILSLLVWGRNAHFLL